MSSTTSRDESRLAALLNIAVNDLDDELFVEEEPEPPRTDGIIHLPCRIATDDAWASRGLELMNTFISEHWKAQTQGCRNIRF